LTTSHSTCILCFVLGLKRSDAAKFGPEGVGYKRAMGNGKQFEEAEQL